MIKIKNLKKEYANTTPLLDVNAVINDGDVISVIGPSGTGKSTLIRCIDLLEKPTSGQIFLDDTEITDPHCNIEEIHKKMGMVFQSFNLFGHMRVVENIMAPAIELLGKDKQEAYDDAMKLLKSVGLTDKALSWPSELSGGQKQRVAIARTLAMNPDVILLDEPTSALDPTMVGEVQAVIRQLAKMGKTMMIVTHEMNFARSISNRVFYMDEGGIYEEGTPEKIFDNPKREKTRRFIRKLKVLELEIRDKNYDFIGTQNEIENYCIKNQISKRQSNHIRLVFEELVQQSLVSVLDKPDIRCVVEYSEEKDSTSFAISYGGNKFDPLKEGDELSLSVLKSAATDIEYKYNDEHELGNMLTMTILT